jgi:hypothetical protein
MLLKLERDLTPLKDAACQKVDEEAEAARLRFLTPGAGQALVYSLKVWEVFEVLSGRRPATGLLAREAKDEGVSEEDKAKQAQAAIGRTLLALEEIESLRLTAKRAIRAAKNTAEIEAAAIVDWES